MNRLEEERYLNRVKLQYQLFAFFKAWQARLKIVEISRPGDPTNYMIDDDDKLVPEAIDAIEKLMTQFDEQIRNNPVARETFLEKTTGTFYEMLCDLNFSYQVSESNASFLARYIYDSLFNPNWKDENKEHSDLIELAEAIKKDGKLYEAAVTRVQCVPFKQIARNEAEARERIEFLHRSGWFDAQGDRFDPNSWSLNIGVVKEVDERGASKTED